ncbi:MAG: CBS domain-containing protein [Desulfobacterales bacterium]|nr:CBS domain-containing protein [Desulfobacterales bacterium]
MKDRKVSQLMIPLSDYATVEASDTLGHAINALKAAQTDTRFVHKHRAVLVLDQDKNIVGKLGIREILKALEPKYMQFAHPETSNIVGLSRFGFSVDFLNSLLDRFELWSESLDELVAQAASRKVVDIMYTPTDGEFVSHDAPVAEAVHQFIIGCHQSLLVQNDQKVIGILRLTDIIDLVCDIME